MMRKRPKLPATTEMHDDRIGGALTALPDTYADHSNKKQRNCQTKCHKILKLCFKNSGLLVRF